MPWKFLCLNHVLDCQTEHVFSLFESVIFRTSAFIMATILGTLVSAVSNLCNALLISSFLVILWIKWDSLCSRWDVLIHGTCSGLISEWVKCLGRTLVSVLYMALEYSFVIVSDVQNVFKTYTSATQSRVALGIIPQLQCGYCHNVKSKYSFSSFLCKDIEFTHSCINTSTITQRVQHWPSRVGWESGFPVFPCYNNKSAIPSVHIEGDVGLISCLALFLRKPVFAVGYLVSLS